MKWIIALSCSWLIPLPATQAESGVEGIVGAAEPSGEQTGEVRLIEPLPDGTETPQSEVAKPRLIFQPEDVISTRVAALGERQIIFQKVSPIDLPPIPEPVSPAEITDPELLARWEAMRADYKETKLVFLGATAYLSEDQPEQPRSFVRFWLPHRAEPIGFWVNANFLWLTGFANFETDEFRYSMLMAISKADLKMQEEIAVHFGRQFEAPVIPEFPEGGKAILVAVQGNPTAEELAPVQALVELYNNEKDRLKLAFEGRMAAAEEKARQLKENPPEKKNIVLKYWRMDRAGQAGVTPKPAIIR